jgi:RNA polymerase sigma-70 factor (ECF subfamily)
MAVPTGRTEDAAPRARSRTFFGRVNDFSCVRDSVPMESPTPLAPVAPFVARALAEIATALPGVAVDEAALVARVGALVGDPAEPRELERLALTDLALADALGRHDRAAIALFERDILSRVEAATRRIAPSGALADAVRQDLRVRLLVGVDGEPKIRTYAARGPLLHWVLVAATRLALDHARRAGAPEEAEADLEDALFDDAERGAMQRESRALLKTWMEEALTALDPQQRAVLQLYFVEDVSSEAAAKMFGVHRGTIARWIDEARASVRSHVRRRALATPGLGPEAIDSMLRAADGYVSLSLSLLRR